MTFTNLFNQIKRSLSVRRCIDCNYYYIPKLNNNSSVYMNSKCMKFLKANAESKGWSDFEYAYIVRSEKTMCGPDGKYFEKPPRPPRTLN